MKFRSAYDYGNEHYCSLPGCRTRQEYVLEVSEGSEPKLVEAGVVDVYDSIQKAAQGLKLEDLIRRARCGDESAIPAVVPTGDLDLSNVPTDILSAHELIKSTRDSFNSLSAEKRALFDNSFDKFLASAADGSIVSILNSSATPNPSLTNEEISKIRTMIGGTPDA